MPGDFNNDFNNDFSIATATVPGGTGGNGGSTNPPGTPVVPSGFSSRTDLIVRVADLLGVTQVAQDLSAEDRQKIDSFVDTASAMLRKGYVIDIDPEQVSYEVFERFSTFIANTAGPAFGRQRDPDLDMREQQRLRNLQTKYSRRRGVTGVEV